jgi:hypothetical protein
MPLPAQSSLRKTFLVVFGATMLSNILQALPGSINNIYRGQMIGVAGKPAAFH